MDRIYLENVNKDFPDLNINELKKDAENKIFTCLNCISNNDTSSLNGKMKSFCDNIINSKGNCNITNIKIHNTVLSKYNKNSGSATINICSSLEYLLNGKKIQDRIRGEYIYVYDFDKLEKNVNFIGINCPNCGSPIKGLGNKSCSYCGTGIVDNYKKEFVINDFVSY